MIFDEFRNEIRAKNGELIKSLFCPLVKGPELRVGDMNDIKCRNCNRTILDLDLMSEGEIIALLDKNPNSCVTFTSDAKNIEIR